MKKKATALLLALIMTLSVLPGTALAKTSTKKSYRKVQSSIKKKKGELSGKKRSAGNLSGQVKSYDRKISKLSEEIEQQEENRIVLERNLAKARKELRAAKEERKKNQNLLDRRMRTMYMYGDTGYLDLIFSSSDFSDLLDKVTMVKSLVSYDRKVIAGLARNEKKIQEKTASIERQKNELDSLVADLDENRKGLSGLRNAKNAELDSTHRDMKSLSGEIAKLERQSDRLSEQIKRESARKTSVVYRENQTSSKKSSKKKKKSKKYNTGGGSLGWPTPGNRYITSEQGRRYCPYHGWETHSGMDIGVSYGDSIVAPASGKITVAGWYGGYGYAVGIDAGLIRGKHVTILLGHNSRVKVRRGQKVKRGQVVAYGGSTGNSTGPHCHFEVHANGYLQNPRKWL